MAAEVSSLIQILSSCKEEQVKNEGNVNGNVLITRDLLGGGSQLGSKELDLDLQVPSGWEKRLDMKSGKIYVQRCNFSCSGNKRSYQEVQDLNFPPCSASKTEKEPGIATNFPEDSLALKLVAPLSSSFDYQSVCTLEKVKLALQKAERESSKRVFNFMEESSTLSSTSSPSSSSSSIREKLQVSDESPGLFAAACPTCLLYVLISRMNPKCPRCNSFVPSPTLKKPRLDLNAPL